MRKKIRTSTGKQFVDGTGDVMQWKMRRNLNRRFARLSALMKTKTAAVMAGIFLVVSISALLIAANWSFLSKVPLLVDVLHCITVLVAIILPCALVLIPVRFRTKVPSYIFRKAMHTVAFVAVVLMILSAKSWQAASLTSFMAALAAFVLLTCLEDEAWYGKLLVQKTRGEIKRSLSSYFLMVAAMIALCWGVFDRPEVASTAILMWGTGDAAAALIGIPCGKHKVRHADGKKSWEGSAAMLLVSFLAGLLMLLFHHVDSLKSLLFAGLGALLGTLTEVYSPSELDTLTVPVVIAAVMLL
ncbi:MAG: hypothetical protein IJ719_14140 [Clostridia bacterium]|nr:hypothetical protein [Clostridia bacterium]